MAQIEVKKGLAVYNIRNFSNIPALIKQAEIKYIKTSPVSASAAVGFVPSSEGRSVQCNPHTAAVNILLMVHNQYKSFLSYSNNSFH